MKEVTKLKLQEAQKYCDDEDKSTAFMIEYMKDYAKVDYDCVMNYLTKFGGFKSVSPKEAKKIRQSGNVI